MSILGEYNLQDFISYLKIINEECERWKTYSILIDLLNIEINVSTMDRIVLGEETAKMLNGKIKTAVIANEKDINNVFMIVAVKRGGNVYVFGNEERAIKWLLNNEKKE